MAEVIGKTNIMKLVKWENICKTIVIILSAAIIYVTIMPLRQRWNDANILLSYLSMMSLATGCVLSTTRKLHSHFALTDVIACAWILYFFVRFYTDSIYPDHTTFLQICQITLMYASLRVLFLAYPIGSRIIILLLIASSAYEGITGVFQCIDGVGRHNQYILTGSFQNPGPFSTYLTMSVALCCSLIKHCKTECCFLIGRHRFETLAYVPLFICASLLPATLSRAAIVALLSILLWMYRDSYYKLRYLVWAGLIIAGIALYFLKQGSADGRMLTWIAALTSWSHQPLFGTGIGSFLHATAEGITEIYWAHPDSFLFTSGGVTDYAFCDLLKVLVEQGLVGFLLCITTVTYVMYLLWLHSKPLFYGMLSLLIFSMFSYPFELLPFRIIIVVIAAWVVTEHSRRAEHKPSRYCTVLPILLIWPSMVLVDKISTRYKADKDYQLFAGMTHEAFIKDYYDLLPLERDNSRFLFDFGKILRLHGRYNDSNDMLRQGTLISADPMFYVLMGNNYKDMGHCDLAEDAYIKAFSIMPNRLYPLYQLMRLYQDAGDSVKAREYATKVVSFKEKITSPATEQMKQEAKEYLHK